MNTKIQKQHLLRKAYVYLRQSSQGQVEKNQESTKRQYALADRAKTLGWCKGQIVTLDSDLGKSGRSTTGRDDFLKLMADVGLGEVGAVLAIEASRFSRSQVDWYKLLDICALTDTLIIDHDGVYNPNDFNDRVLLGFKGTWSHTELHAINLRMQGARLNKAKRGELRFERPTGYVYGSEGKLILDPDECVVETMRLLFKKFRELGSAYQVAHYFHHNKILFPWREWTAHQYSQVEWQPLTQSRVLRILKNPTYTGAYVYGRERKETSLDKGKLITKSVKVEQLNWIKLKKGHHEPYVSWNEFSDNQKRIEANKITSTEDEHMKNPRTGKALLVGLVICGRCGSKMRTKYKGTDGRNPCYECSHSKPIGGSIQCWEVSKRFIDEAVVIKLMSALNKSNLDISLAVLNEIETHKADKENHWHLQIQRAEYEANRAQKQYDNVDPENRLVARSLEQRWNEKLEELERLSSAYEESSSQDVITLSNEQRSRIIELSKDIPKLWESRKTSYKEKKEIISLLIKQICLTPVDIPQKQTKISILWHTGHVDELFVDRPRGGAPGYKPELSIIKIIKEQVDKHVPDKKIAAILNEKGFCYYRNKEFKASSVGRIRYQNSIERPGTDLKIAGKTDPRPDGRYSSRALAEQLQVSTATIRKWQQQGKIDGRQDVPGGPWWFKVSKNDIEDLKRERDKLRFTKRNIINKRQFHGESVL
jgi:DNA invertase Pin-like site-specific DNA recombinase/DNA-directed RNA polymerase subunit M/transcription elongation factor TFIIS